LIDKEVLSKKTILSYDEAIEYLSIARGTFYVYRQLYDFPDAVTIRGQQYFMLEELERWRAVYRIGEEHDITCIDELKNKEMLKRNEAMLYTGLSGRTLARMIRKKDFPEQTYTFQYGLFRRSDLDIWLNKRKEKIEEG